MSYFILHNKVKIIISIFCFIITLALVLPQNAHAGYLDPGSGSTLVQSIVAIFAFLGRMIEKIKKALFFWKKN